MKIENKQKINNKYNIDRKFNWLPISLILFLAAVLYFYQIDQESLWLDEIFSIRAAKRNFSDFSFNRPLYFILLNFWMRFGDSEAWLRSLSVVFGLVSVWLIYQLGVRLSNRATGLIAALLLTLSPVEINHAQEIRMYVMSVCLGLAGSLALTNVLEVFTVSSVAGWLSLRFMAVLTTPLNILLFVPDIFLLRIKLRNYTKYLFKTARKWLWLLIVLTPIILIALNDVTSDLFRDTLGKYQQVVPPPGISAFVGSLTRFTVWPLALPFTSSEFISEQFFNFYALILLSLIGFALFARTKSPSIKLWWAAAWSFLPLTILFIFCQTYTQLWGVDRYLLFTAPYTLILFAAGWLRLWCWQKRIAAVVAVIYLIAVGGALFNYYTVEYRQDWRGVVQTISVDEQPGDVIALFPKKVLPALNYYYQGNSPVYTIENTLESLPKEKDFPPIDKLLLKQMFRDLFQIKSRFWLVFTFAHSGDLSDKNQLVESVINEYFDILTHRSFTGIDLFLVNPFNNEPPPEEIGD